MNIEEMKEFVSKRIDSVENKEVNKTWLTPN